MNKKNKIIIIGIIVLLIIVLISVILLKVVKINDKEEDNYFYSFDQKYTIKICKSDDCKVPNEIKYDLLELKNDIPELNSSIKKINNDTIKYYNETKKSKLDGEECSSVKNIYKYRNITTTYFSNYESDKYIVIAVNRIHRDLCSKENTNDSPEVYIYDKINKKIISEKEFKENENITDDLINTAINYYNEEYKLNCTINEKSKIYYSNEGNLIISVYDENTKSYHDIELFR